jgi:hypothetical protein
VSPEQLLSDYNFYRFHTANTQSQRFSRTVKPTKERLGQLSAMHQWCAENGIDSRLWLYYLFRSRHWRFAPSLWQLIPSKRNHKKAIQKFEALTDVELYAKRTDQEVQARRREEGTEQPFDPNRDLSHASELLKQRLIDTGQVAECMGRMNADTFGYHPKSAVCARCPVAVECEGRLSRLVGFDIQALRRGELTVAQAQHVVAAGAYHGRN